MSVVVLSRLLQYPIQAALMAGFLLAAVVSRPQPAFAEDRTPEPAESKSATAGQTEYSQEAAEIESEPLKRLPPRPELSESEYATLAESLRLEYSKNPNDWPKPQLDEGVEHRELGLMSRPEFPDNNPYSNDKADLGLRLFFEPRLSGSGQIACASCHDPELGWADGRAVPYGHDRGLLKRHAPSLLNTAHADRWFWDGRVDSLEAQALQVMSNPAEMSADVDQVLKLLKADRIYPFLFEKVFGTPEITTKRISQALATYERTILSEGRTPFDRFLRGEHDALSDSAIRGLHLFRTDARCLNCHNGPNFTDNKLHNLGLTYYGRELEDLGLYNATKKPEDVGKFKTPTLRNIARTSPYMHNGLFDLEGVLNMYNAGMGRQRRKPGQENDPLFPVKSPHLRSLGLNDQDQADLTSFLESLTERRRRVRVPETQVGP
jgi:cytochrome c peroxidase